MFNLRGIHKIFQNNIFVSRTFQRIHWQLSLYKCRLYGLCANWQTFCCLCCWSGGGGGDCRYQEPWLPFWENVAKLLEGRTRINKLNVPLKVKVWKICNIEIFWQRQCKICMMIFCVLRILFTLRNHGYGFHNVCVIMGHIFQTCAE